ncbi:choline transporter-like protein 4 isoform X2 [Actinia tenebrosa]|uniref:Choline transporter-like protein n=1 Tax=Actinia tenebrosa TaxID=6105 RepID=A0A6P8J3J1_ACTTE|nr:choline transporter-like protein 4 isoform X2 [Actinia tenebrosa]
MINPEVSQLKTKMADEVDLGKKRSHDPAFKGPIEDRSCTDIICCILFVAYIIGMVVVGIIAFIEGDLDRLLLPTDSQGKVCGKDYPNQKYLVFFDLTKCIKFDISQLSSPSCPTPQVCVSKCPTKNEAGITVSYENMICKPGIAKPNTTSERTTLIKESKCAPYYLASAPVLYRCIPTGLGGLNKHVTNSQSNANVTGTSIYEAIKNLKIVLDAQNVGMKIIDDVKAVWYWILVGFILAMVLALIYIVITRWIAGPLIWFTILAVIALIIFGMYWCFSKFKMLNDSGESKPFELKFTVDLSTYKDSKETWLALGILLSIMLVIILLILLVMCSRIKIAVEMISEASKALSSMLSTLFFPLIPWLMQLILFVWFIAVLLYLSTNGKPQYETVDVPENDIYNLTNSADCNAKTFDSMYPNTSASCILIGYKENKYLLRMQVYHFFGWLWIMNFIIALGQCVLAGAFASWYFAFDKPEDIPTLPVLSSFWRTIRYHTGSLAFGAAIIAIVQMIRAVLEYIDRKLKEYGQDNKAVKFILCCCKCCFWCLEKCLRFLNKNAYIVIAIYGKNFCSSAKDAFQLLLRNVLRVAAVNSVTSFLLFLGKVFVTGIIGVASYFWFRKVNEDDPTSLNYDVVPVIITIIFAYVVTVLFFDVYDMCIDTIFLCFLEDIERNNGSVEKPYYMSDSLKKILQKQNRGSVERVDGASDDAAGKPKSDE